MFQPPTLTLQPDNRTITRATEFYSSSSSCSTFASLFALFHPRLLMQQHQDMINRHNLCLTRLREAAKETESLRQENTSLRSINRDLNKQVSPLNIFASSDYNTTPFDLVNMLGGLCLDGGRVGEQEVSNTESAVDVDRVRLPKSISVRSSGYLKTMSQAGTKIHRGKTRRPTRTGNVSQLSLAKVYVQGGKEEEPLELEVYNQGMFKTELCNKWQETGACPYGGHCQFAHSIGELCLVIRNFRHKTEVCRMVLAGDVSLRPSMPFSSWSERTGEVMILNLKFSWYI